MDRGKIDSTVRRTKADWWPWGVRGDRRRLGGNAARPESKREGKDYDPTMATSDSGTPSRLASTGAAGGFPPGPVGGTLWRHRASIGTVFSGGFRTQSARVVAGAADGRGPATSHGMQLREFGRKATGLQADLALFERVQTLLRADSLRLQPLGFLLQTSSQRCHEESALYSFGWKMSCVPKLCQ